MERVCGLQGHGFGQQLKCRFGHAVAQDLPDALRAQGKVNGERIFTTHNCNEVRSRP